jgi:hypothetical protein
MAGDEDAKAELSARLARARAQIDRSGGEVRAALDVPARIRTGFQRHAWAWLGGAILTGVLIAKLPPRTRKVRVTARGEPSVEAAAKTGLALAIGKIAFDLARPVLLKMAMEKLRPWIERRFGLTEE